jgi:hypothetical protein
MSAQVLPTYYRVPMDVYNNAVSMVVAPGGAAALGGSLPTSAATTHKTTSSSANRSNNNNQQLNVENMISFSGEGGATIYGCTHCSKKYRHKHHLEQHLIVHTTERPYECTLCSCRFKQQRNLQRHHNMTHTKRPKFANTSASPFTCQLCAKTFKTMKSMTRHETGVHGFRRRQQDQLEQAIAVAAIQFRGTLKYIQTPTYTNIFSH